VRIEELWIGRAAALGPLLALAFACVGCLPPSGGGSGSGSGSFEDAGGSTPSMQPSAMGPQAGREPLRPQADAASPDAAAPSEDVGPPGQWGEGPECADGMSNEETIDATCGWLESCWQSGESADGTRLCSGFVPGRSEAEWAELCRSAPFEIVLSFCDFQTCEEAETAWRTYPVDFASFCDDDAGGRPSTPAPGSAGTDPEPACDADTSEARCLQGCDWLVECGERPQCDGATRSMEETCVEACGVLGAQLAVFLCDQAGCDVALRTMSDTLGAQVPECED